jgi:hypothetical protein
MKLFIWLNTEGYESCDILTLVVGRLAKEQTKIYISVFIHGPSNTASSFNPRLLLPTSSGAANAGFRFLGQG